MTHEKSKRLYEEACQYIPGGVNSPVRSFVSTKEVPLFVKKAVGSHIYDVDDNVYLDYIGSWGPMMIGHSHPILLDAMKEAMQNGFSYGLCCEGEVRLAKLICDAYLNVEMVRMVNSGTEAVMSAIRVARGFTHKDKIIKFEGCYHGHSDALLVKAGSGALTFGSPTSPGVPADVVKHTIVCTYNDIASVEEVLQLHKQSVAAMIIEPIAGNMGVIPADKEFLAYLRKRCDEEGIVLIFDEVISGFRVAYGGAQELYGIHADITCFGKIIGAGLPVGAYGGKREILSCVSPVGPVYQAGTLSGNPLAMHVGSTLLNYLKEHPEIYTQLAEKGAYLKEGIEHLLKKKQLPYQVHQIGSLLTLFFTKQSVRTYQDVMTCQQELFQIYFHSLYEDQILIAPSMYEAMFLSMAHTKEELDETLLAIDNALEKVRQR